MNAVIFVENQGKSYPNFLVESKEYAMLLKVIDEYLLWMVKTGYSPGTLRIYGYVLRHFHSFVTHRKMHWDKIFTIETESMFREETGLTNLKPAVRGLSKYLYHQKMISAPIKNPAQKLPAIYGEYMSYFQHKRQVQDKYTYKILKTLSAFNEYLTKNETKLKDIKIETVDTFLAVHCKRFAPVTRQKEIGNLRSFLKYLYQDRKILRRDLAPFLVSATIFADAKPAKFLRVHEMQQILTGLDTTTSKGLRLLAMVHLAFTLGLRPKEISLITLDDISFTNSEISLKDRKSNNPVKLPLPDNSIKAIAAYMIGARPKSNSRLLFLRLRVPHTPINSWSVSSEITSCFHKANIKGSAYWLRHTYAQNLLEQNVSVFEIKQMLGHDRIQTTQRYIQIDIKRMRKVLFYEYI